MFAYGHRHDDLAEIGESLARYPLRTMVMAGDACRMLASSL